MILLTSSLERSMNGEMMACSPKEVSPGESTIEETNGRDDVDGMGVDLEENFRSFEEYPWLC